MAIVKSKIVGPDGEPIQYEVLDREISGGGVTGIRNPWHGGVADNLTPERLASILRSAADGNNYEYLTLAEEMEERDGHYASVLSTRKLALASLNIRVDSFSDEARDVEIAEAVRAIVATPDFSDMVFDLADALGKGYSVAEIIWDRSGKVWTPERFEHRDPRFFCWDRQTGQQLRLLDEADPAYGIPLAPYKFLVHRPKLRSGLAVRGGLARLSAVAYMCKAWAWKDWMAFADVFGLPMRVGTYGPGAKEEDIARLMRAVANLGSDAAAVIHESTKITFEAAPNTGGAADFFERLANFWDKQTSKAVLGQTMTTDDGASLSQAKVHNEVREDLLKADARGLENTLNSDLVRPFVDLNFGPGRYPHVVVQVPEPEDLKLLVDALVQLVPMGLEVEQSIIRDKLNLPDPAIGKDVKLLRAPAQQPATPPAPTPPAPPQQAENREQQPAPAPDREDQLGALLADAADPLVGEWVDQVRELVDNAGSLEQVRDGLLDLLPQMDAGKFAQVMQHALAVAGAAGMLDALDDSRA
jgi:phage gp29-like protein